MRCLLSLKAFLCVFLFKLSVLSIWYWMLVGISYSILFYFFATTVLSPRLDALFTFTLNQRELEFAWDFLISEKANSTLTWRRGWVHIMNNPFCFRCELGIGRDERILKRERIKPNTHSKNRAIYFRSFPLCKTSCGDLTATLWIF